MHRNTYLLVSVLAVFAALLIGVNIGRQFGQPETVKIPQTPAIQTTPSSSVTAVPAMKPYRNAFCKVSFDYPGSLTVLENASGSAAFSGASADEGILLTCQKDIPRPSVEKENIEEVRIGTVSAKLYHASVDTLIVRHPGTKLDVFLASTSEMLRALISTLRLLP